jgi:cytochrome c biogenesis protein ResB
MWKFLNSRQTATYVLGLFLGMLFVSALIPSQYTVPPQKWEELRQTSPALFWLYAHGSTPALVRSPLFCTVSFLLFLSTLSCTCERLKLWSAARRSPFSKEKSFSFSVERQTPRRGDLVDRELRALLAKERWQLAASDEGGSVLLAGEKGGAGFWGSMIFHAGMIIAFLAAPATYFTGYNGEVTVVENDRAPLREVLVNHGGDPGPLATSSIKVHGLRSEYYQGRFRYDFGGVLAIDDGAGQDLPFAVNQPASYRGYQFALSSFGFAPHLLLKNAGKPVFDAYLNVSSDQESNYFPLGGELRAQVLFFPDFVREGGKIGTRSRDPRNPVAMVKIFRGDREVFKGLFPPGQEQLWEGTVVSVPDYKRWVTLTVSRDYGVILIMIGSVLAVSGLFARFISNERRIEFLVAEAGSGTRVRISGYSRYYPAFLEKEVLRLAERVQAQ